MKEQPTFSQFLVMLEESLGPLDREQLLGSCVLYEAFFGLPSDPYNEKLIIED